MMPVLPLVSSFHLGVYLWVCMRISIAHARSSLRRAEVGIGSLGAIVSSVCEPSCGCWGMNSNPLEEQDALLIPEPFL